jgi:hypothetical protein
MGTACRLNLRTLLQPIIKPIAIKSLNTYARFKFIAEFTAAYIHYAFVSRYAKKALIPRLSKKSVWRFGVFP